MIDQEKRKDTEGNFIMCINLGQCVDSTTTDTSSKFDVGSKTNIKIYLDKQKTQTLCLEIEILAQDPDSSSSRYKLGKVLKIGNSTDKNLLKILIREKGLRESSKVKFV